MSTYASEHTSPYIAWGYPAVFRFTKSDDEPLPDFAATSARKTMRLVTALQAIGMALGGNAGARLAAHLRLPERILDCWNPASEQCGYKNVLT